jgi:succinate dehydrogenase / fumarate reductase iron-sulfur subunit
MADRVGATLVLEIARTPRATGGGGDRRHFARLTVAVDPARDSVLDVIERAWATVDRGLVFRHACHHASCGTCALRVNGREILPCVAPLESVWDGRSALRIEPLRNVPVVADLAVDPSAVLVTIAGLRFPYVRTVEADVRACAGARPGDPDVGAAERFEDCLECLACVSACPVAAGDDRYLGPAVLAAADRIVEEADRDGSADAREHARSVLELVDGDHGIWQCRSTFACTAVCPSSVDPGTRIMDLRRRSIRGGAGGRSG